MENTTIRVNALIVFVLHTLFLIVFGVFIMFMPLGKKIVRPEAQEADEGSAGLSTLSPMAKT